MATVITGYKRDNKGSYIAKSPGAQLVYSMDWGTEWMPAGDNLASVSYTVSSHTGDTAPLTVVSEGTQGDVSYVELAGGTPGTVYTVTASIETANQRKDERGFRILCEERSI